MNCQNFDRNSSSWHGSCDSGSFQGVSRMKTNLFKSTLALAVMTAAIGAVSTADAATYQWTWNKSPINYNTGGGKINNATAYYRQEDQQFGFHMNMSNIDGVSDKPSGYWLAVSNGPNPKGYSGELAIFYFDASGASPVLTAYGYNGQNGNTSFYDGSGAAGIQAPDKIASSMNNSAWIKSLKIRDNANGTRDFAFDIAGSVINSYQPQNQGIGGWKGVAFEQNFGIWLHPVTRLSTQYGQDGFLTQFQAPCQGWLDLNDQTTQCVPEPGSMAALGMGALAMIRRRKARKA